MRKFPSPSVVCAQNSPVTLTTGLTRSRSTSTAAEHLAQLRERPCRVIAIQVIAHLAERVGPVFQRLALREARAERRGQSIEDVGGPTLAQARRQELHALVHDAIGFALTHFERSDLIGHIVHHIAQVERVERGHPEVDRELQPRLARRGLDAVRLLEEQDPEAVEAGVLHGEPVLRLVHPEAARPARSRREEHVAIDDVLPRHALRLECVQKLDEVPDHEVGRIALPVVAVLLAKLERGDVWSGHHLHAIAGRLERGLQQGIVLPREPADQDGHLVAFSGCERHARQGDGSAAPPGFLARRGRADAAAQRRRAGELRFRCRCGIGR